MHVKFDDKEPGNETPEQHESFADIQATEDTSEPDQTEESEDSLEAEPTLEAQNEVASDEAQDGSQQANQSKNTFKYKSSHPEDQIIGNKDSPRRTRSYFRQEESMILKEVKLTQHSSEGLLRKTFLLCRYMLMI